MSSFTSSTKEPKLNTPNTALRIGAEEKKELQRLAAAAGIPLSLAFRRGAKAYLLALTDESSELPMGRPAQAKGGKRAA
jgi:hypothetical protein